MCYRRVIVVGHNGCIERQRYHECARRDFNICEHGGTVDNGWNNFRKRFDSEHSLDDCSGTNDWNE